MRHDHAINACGGAFRRKGQAFAAQNALRCSPSTASRKCQCGMGPGWTPRRMLRSRTTWKYRGNPGELVFRKVVCSRKLPAEPHVLISRQLELRRLSTFHIHSRVGEFRPWSAARARVRASVRTCVRACVRGYEVEGALSSQLACVCFYVMCARFVASMSTGPQLDSTFTPSAAYPYSTVHRRGLT